MLSRSWLAVLMVAMPALGAVTISCQREGERSQPAVARGTASQPAGAMGKTLDEPEENPSSAVDPGGGVPAIRSAAEAGKYLFVFFYRDARDEQTRRMREIFDGAVKKVADRARHIEIDVSDPSERPIVEKFGADRAPMPLVLALAPNGAVTGGFPTTFEEKQIVEAFASPSMEECLKALQERKIVLLCVQNESTALNDAAMLGVRDFKADSRYGQWTEVVTLDPADKAEAKALENLQVDPSTREAVTVFIVPPGSALARFKGGTSKDMLVAALNSASSGCGPGGCGPGGCGPAKK